MSDVKPPPNAQIIEVNGRIIDPKEHYARDASNTDHIIVTSHDVLKGDQITKLQQLGVIFLEDLGNNNYLCTYAPKDLKPLRNLECVQQVDVYRNLYKISDALQASVDEAGMTFDASQTYPIDVMVHQDVKDIEALADNIAQTIRVDRSQFEVLSNSIRMEVHLADLRAIAADDRVRILEEVVAPVLSDDQAKLLISAPIPSREDCTFSGKGQIIAVADSGFDLGSTTDCHPAFNGKIRQLIPIGRAQDAGMSDTSRVNDPKGHGTHVCGTIVGREIQTSEGWIGGVAQDAQIVLSSLEQSDGDLIRITQIATLYQKPYTDHGARIHSNSWGDGLSLSRGQRPYGAAACGIDDFVLKNPDALIVFSAGNNNVYINEDRPPGTQLPAIGSQAAAKNCLTVGASGSTRVVEGELVAKLDPNQICKDSSRGPTKENRIKPDVVAPGYNIFSAHSRHPKAQRLPGPQATNESCPGVTWRIRSGTSHATPLVSGCAAILRELLQSQGNQTPPAALLKAVIINGAERIPNIETSAQGFGRVNLKASVEILRVPPLMADKIGTDPVVSEGGSLIGAPLKQDAKLEFNLAPAQDTAGLDLKVTMVYNDRPGGQIQNNLNLTIIDATNNVVKHGGISEDEIDKQNNVEQIIWSPAPQVPVIVRVFAQKIFPGSEQDFALAWSVSKPLVEPGS